MAAIFDPPTLEGLGLHSRPHEMPYSTELESLAVGGAQPGIGPAQLGFRAHSVIVHNVTGSWFFCPASQSWIPPNMVNLVLVLHQGSEFAQLVPETPPGKTSTVTNGEICRTIWTALQLNPTPGTNVGGGGGTGSDVNITNPSIPVTQSGVWSVGVTGTVSVSGAAGKGAPIDRTPLAATVSYDAAAVAPHAVTQRALYTVPANRLALVQATRAAAIRTAAATVVGKASASVKDGSVNAVAPGIARADVQGNDVGDRDKDAFGWDVQLVAGASIALETADASTGGAFDYACYANVLEFAV